MAQITATIFKTESGVHNIPGVQGTLNTHCDGGTLLPKQFKEVFIYVNAGAWVETPVWNSALSNIRVALRVDNVCEGVYSYIDYRYNDFRLAQSCCKNCSVIYWSMTNEVPGTLLITVNGIPVVNESDPDGQGEFSVKQGDVVNIVVSGEFCLSVLLVEYAQQVINNTAELEETSFQFTVQCGNNYTVNARNNILE